MKYEITDPPFSVVEVRMNRGESINTDSGAMLWMTPNIRMNTKAQGLKGLATRMLAGETLMINNYEANGDGAIITLAPKDMGSIVDFQLNQGDSVIIQKSVHLASTNTVTIEPHLQKKIMTAMFGGEGFIMQKVRGPGVLFIEVTGGIRRVTLKESQSLIIQTTNLVAMTPRCTLEVEQVPGYINKFLGGEGLFNTRVTGPGTVWIQTHNVGAQEIVNSTNR